MILGGTEIILFVDDEEQRGKMAKAMLEKFGHTITLQTNNLEALSTFQNNPKAFDLFITDQIMPGMTGFDLARRMLQTRSGMPIILRTGYSSIVSEDEARSLVFKGFAMKPLSKKDIAAMIRKVLDGGNRLPKSLAMKRLGLRTYLTY